jgi:hypothetical protein
MVFSVRISSLLISLVYAAHAAPVLEHGSSSSSSPNHQKEITFGASDSTTKQPIANPKWDEYSIHYINDSPKHAEARRKKIKEAFEHGIINKQAFEKETEASRLREHARNFILNGGVVRDFREVGDADYLHLSTLTPEDIAYHSREGYMRGYWHRIHPNTKDSFYSSVRQLSNLERAKLEANSRWNKSQAPNMGRHVDQAGAEHSAVYSAISGPSSPARSPSPPNSPFAYRHIVYSKEVASPPPSPPQSPARSLYDVDHIHKPMKDVSTKATSKQIRDRSKEAFRKLRGTLAHQVVERLPSDEE